MRLVARTLLVALAGLLLWTSGWHSSARQQDRQLVQGTGSEASAGKRIALVIGNGAYINAPPLKNPTNDARDMADTLSKLGFEVEHGVDLNQKQMKFMLRQFGQRLKVGGQGVFYYAGHGVQSKGSNYLIPVDAQVESDADLEDACVDVQLMLNYMDDAQNGLNIVILDACRTNPFARSIRSAESGLAQLDAPTGTLIAYATAPGRVASDGTGQNGLYTSELLKQMRVPGLSVTEMFMRVRAEVVKQTNGKQVPWEASSLIGNFSFNAAANSASTTTGKPGVMLEDGGALEAEYWGTIKNSTEATDFQEYLKEYPQGRYTQLARLKLRQLQAAKSNRNNNDVNVIKPNGGNQPSGTTTSETKAAPKAGTTIRNQMGIEFVYIPLGSFMMGASDEEAQAAYENKKLYDLNASLTDFANGKPQHEVTFREGFYMGRYEVTQAQWKSIIGKNPSHFKNCDQCPVEKVSWNDAQVFIRKLNARSDGFQYRLPSEAEWEYACRAGATTAFAFGDSLSADQANFNEGNLPLGGISKKTFRQKTMPVGSFQPNAWGLYDMHGNVWEWCEDVWHENYNGAPIDGTAWISGAESRFRVVRGGSWYDQAYILGSSRRAYLIFPDLSYSSGGLRLVAVALK